MRDKQKLKYFALTIVGLIGVVLIILPAPEGIDKSVFLSVGGSMLATAISTFVLTIGDGSKDADYASLILGELGIDAAPYKRRNAALAFPRSVEPGEIEKCVNKELGKHKIDELRTVGHRRTTSLRPYYDLIGATCEKGVAEYFAKILSSYWSYFSTDMTKVAKVEFDFVVTPKGGSPILGYEFAKIIKKPFVLHEENERFPEDDMRKWFDCAEIPAEGKTALIVDDSTTGGSMVLEAAKHLREYGYFVNTCFVVFEPAGKDARARLEQNEIQLVSIVKTNKKVDRG